MSKKKLMLEIRVTPKVNEKPSLFDAWYDEENKEFIVCYQNFDTTPEIAFEFYPHEGDLKAILSKGERKP